ncbi:MAG: AmmeMemoRadiSam system protein B [Spirochaetales bacterium]|nr:AmmeMemoRadiSam system protein B [Spirochaetales bacterium]
MNIRPRTLPPGWYPSSQDRVERVIIDFMVDHTDIEQTIYSGIVPHAGWGFSGSIACRVISHLDPDISTIIVVGGHLSPGKTVLAAFEEGYSTPLGILKGDIELLGAIQKEMDLTEDLYSDNTVEIQLPFIKYFFPDVHVLGMRAAPSAIAEDLGKVICEAARTQGKKVAVIGSTDLTHYGSNYGYAPKGSGAGAVEWVKTQNDKKFIDACLAMDSELALSSAQKDKSACSAGGAVCAMSFAHAMGGEKGLLLEYKTSWDVQPSESFVGYAGILYPKTSS